jgi:hypothetical protein
MFCFHIHTIPYVTLIEYKSNDIFVRQFNMSILLTKAKIVDLMEHIQSAVESLL